MRLHDIAVVGASGLVGRKILEIIQERHFEVGKVVAIAAMLMQVRSLMLKAKPLSCISLSRIYLRISNSHFSPQAEQYHASGLPKPQQMALL